MHFNKAFIIGLPKHTGKRLERCFKRCKREGIDALLWPGIYGLDVDIEKYKQLGYLSKNFQLTLPGSLGCMLSHITLWEKLEKDPSCDIALICEDDILLNSDFQKKLNHIPWSEVPDNWDIIKLSYHGLNGTKISNNIIKPSTIKKKATNSGTFCYLMKTSSASILKSVLLPYDGRNSMDVLLRNNINKFNPYLLAEKLATEERYRFSIRKSLNYSARKLSWFEKIYIKISRLFLSNY